MSEENIEIIARQEAIKITAAYLNEIGWTKQMKTVNIFKIIPDVQKKAERDHDDEQEGLAEERFREQLDRLRADKSELNNMILQEVVRILGKRRDLTYFGQKMISRIKEELTF